MLKQGLLLSFVLAVLLISVCFAEDADNKAVQIDVDEAVIIAVKSSPVLESSRLGVDIARYELNRVKKLTNPTISASGSFVQSGPKRKNDDGEKNDPDQQGFVTGTVTMPLDIMGAMKTAKKAQGCAYDAEAFSFEASLCGLIYNVKSAFFNCLSLHDQLENAKSTLEISKQNLEKVSNEVEVGNKPKFDRTRQEYDVTAREAQVTAAEGAYIQALNSFNYILGVTGQKVYIPVHNDSCLEASVSGVDMEKDNLVEIALKERPEIKQLEKLLEGNNLYIDVVKLQYKPTFNLTASYTENFLHRDLNGKHNWSAMANVSVPIFTGGVAKEEVSKAAATRDQVKNSYVNQMQNVATEVINAVQQLKTASTQITTAEKGVQLAEESVEIANLRYEEQLGTYLDVSTALDTLYQAQNTLISAKYAYVVSVYNLEKTLGRQREISELMTLVWEGTE